MLLVCVLTCGVWAADDFDTLYTSFQEAVANQDDATAMEDAETLFAKLTTKYRADAGFGAFKSKLMASEFLSRQMIQQLQKATGTQMYVMTGKILNKPVVKTGAANRKEDVISVAPAKSFYDTSIELFQKPIDISTLSDKEREFLQDYYNLKLRKYTTDIAKAGQALTIARPGFNDTHHYVLVLPLLHFIEPQEVPLDVLPAWMRKANQLDAFSDSCLMHYGLSYHAMSFARRASQNKGQAFSELKFYQSEAEKCKKSDPHIAVDCLKRAMDLLKDQAKRQIAVLNQIIQIWLDSENYDLAASEAKHLTNLFGQYPEAGKAHWLYFYSLSRANNSLAILSEIDDVLDNPKCKPYRAKMLYIKWWALRRQRDHQERVAVLEHELIKLYGDDSMVAPVLLSRATDLLAAQDYNGAYELLSQLNEKFPATKAAEQSRKILEKLKTLTNRG